MSEIPYCEKVLEVTGGCAKCSPGCTHCWAIKEVWRMAHNPLQGDKWQGLVEKKNGVLNWTGKIKCFPEALEIPLRRKKPITYFVDSKADLFHKNVPFEFIDKVWDVMFDCMNLENNPVVLYAKKHTFLVLTKRPKRLLEFAGWKKEKGERIDYPNVHLGVSISNQAEADEKIPILLQIPAAVRWLSIEPMLEGIIIPKEYLGKEVDHAPYFPFGKAREKELTAEQFISGDYPDNFIDGVILGGESGPGARPISVHWPRNIRDQCIAAGVLFFFKQWGEWIDHSLTDIRPTKKNALIVFPDGSTWPWSILCGRKYDTASKAGGRTVIRVGKKKAGCLLDGKEYKELPERSGNCQL